MSDKGQQSENKRTQGLSIGTIIPAYWRVDKQKYWDRITLGKTLYPDSAIIVIIPLEAAYQAILPSQRPYQNEWRAVIKELYDMGILLAGRVDTKFGERPLHESMADAMLWKSAYPHQDVIPGVFFDRMSNQTDRKAYYQVLHEGCRNNSGYDFTVGNAGGPVPLDFLDGTIADIVIVKDSGGLEAVDSTYQRYAPYDDKKKSSSSCGVGVLAHSVTGYDASWVAQITKYVDWVYMTESSGSYTTGPPVYLDTLLSQLDSLNKTPSSSSSSSSSPSRML